MENRVNSNMRKFLLDKNDNRLPYLELAIQVAFDAGKKVKKAFSEPKDISSKACASDLVTKTDQEVESFIFTQIREKFPSHRFIGEESVSGGSSCLLTDDPTWIIDPIDGTVNFVHRFPFVAVSIGLAIKQDIELGVIYNPILDQLYYGVKGAGAYCECEQLHVSEVTDLSQALLLSEWGSDRDSSRLTTKAENMRKAVGSPSRAGHGMRSTGSCCMNMCFIASGSADAYFEWGIHCWDMAAGKIIVQEAGGVSLNDKGGDFDLMARSLICAANAELATQVAETVTPLLLPRD